MISQGVCNSFIMELLASIHDDGDSYKMALYTSSATLGKTTTAYSATNEVSGTGYIAGGIALTGYTVSFDSGKIILTFDSPVVWDPSTITARGALIYNSSKSNKAVMVLDFGADKSSISGPFTLNIPTADASTGLIRFNNS